MQLWIVVVLAIAAIVGIVLLSLPVETHTILQYGPTGPP
jgi:hypothetical protein